MEIRPVFFVQPFLCTEIRDSRAIGNTKCQNVNWERIGRMCRYNDCCLISNM